MMRRPKSTDAYWNDVPYNSSDYRRWGELGTQLIILVGLKISESGNIN